MPNSFSRNAVLKPSCQQCYRKLDSTSVRHTIEIAEKKQVVGINEISRMSQENWQKIPATQRIRDEQWNEYQSLDEYSRTQTDINVGFMGPPRYPGREQVPGIVSKRMAQRVPR